MIDTTTGASRASEPLLGIQAVAERLLISTDTVYRLVSRHDLACYRLPGGLRFKASDIEAFLERRRSDALPHQPYGSREAGR